jgi:hypothetical protein
MGEPQFNRARIALAVGWRAPTANPSQVDLGYRPDRHFISGSVALHCPSAWSRNRLRGVDTI